MTLTPLFQHAARPRLVLRTEPQVPQLARRQRIGLLGGSFNPAHEGHLYISVEALRLLALDAVWWLVSPQNPLKSRHGMAPFADRLKTAEKVATHPRIRVTDLEKRLGTVFTIDTVTRLTRLSEYRFVWLIGADNLEQMSRWRRWRDLAQAMPIAVFDRTPYSHAAMASRFAAAFRGARMPEYSSGHLVETAPPVWTYIHLRPHPASSTALREAARREAETDALARSL